MNLESNTKDILSDYDVKPKEAFQVQHWIVLIVLWIGIFTCIFFGIILSPLVLVGSLLLALVTLLMFVHTKKGVSANALLLLIGIFGLAHFSPYRYCFNLGIGALKISFDLVLLLLFILHYYLNRSIIYSDLASFFQRKKTEVEPAMPIFSLERVKEFKVKFNDKTVKELHRIAQSERYVVEAKQACKELLVEKEGSEQNE